MAFKIIHLVILFIGGCNAGVVPQHFTANHTEPVDVKIEGVPTNFYKNESNASLGILKEAISNIAVGNEDFHNTSKVSIVGFHNISEELNRTKLNVSEESHHFVDNHLKEFDHSKKSDTKGSGRSRKKSSKVSNRPKKSVSKEKKNFEKVTKGHFNKDSLNESHHLEDFAREISHPDKDFLKKSGHAVNRMEHHFKDLSNGSHHPEDFVKGSNHFDNDVSRIAHHVENVTNISFNQNEINGSDQADEIVDRFNHFSNLLNESHHQENVLNHSDSDVSKGFIEDDSEDHFSNLLNESHHQENVLNHSDSDVSKGFIEDDSVAKPVHQVEQNASRHFENVSETRNETSTDFEAINFLMHFDNTSGISDETAESSSNSFKIMDDQIDFLHHADNISQDILLRPDPSDLNTFHEDNIHKIDVGSHSENQTSEMNPLIRHESLNSSETALNDTEIFGLDIRISSAKENSSSDLGRKQSLLDVPHKEDSLMNPQLNETNSNDAYVMFTVSPNEYDTNSSTELSHEFLRNLEVNANESKLNTDINDSNIMAVEENATQGLFSGINLDFLLNSELAKNAASAMEVFNFTDSALTDHIMDNKNDVHDFLDLIHPSEESDQSDSKEEFHGNKNIKENLNLELNSSISEEGERFKVATTTMLSPTLLNSTVDFEETTIVSQLMLNSTVKFEETSKAVSDFNSTVDFEETTIVSQPMLNSTVAFEETTKTVSVFNSTVEFVDAICPPPGFCIFWFLAQDTCAVNSHCLGSRICCRIGCAKTCIEV